MNADKNKLFLIGVPRRSSAAHFLCSAVTRFSFGRSAAWKIGKGGAI
jgi:hypothetical protein